MRPVLTAAQMRDADRRTIEEIGLPGAVLMENAGAAVARVLRDRYPHARRPLILCGRGNNGGDGFVIARHLLDLEPAVFLFGTRQEVRGDARLHMGVFERSGGALVEVTDEQGWTHVRAAASRADVAVDALLGTGLHQAPTGAMADAIALLRSLPALPVVAVDIPSGVPSDSGELGWDAVRAALTVTFAAPKYGDVLPPACDQVGALVVADIGIAASSSRRPRRPSGSRRSPTSRRPIRRGRPARTRARSGTCSWPRARWARRARPSSPPRAPSCPGRGWSRSRHPRPPCPSSRTGGRS